MISFEDRAVAFIDVIGFKALVNKAPVNPPDLAELDQLVGLLGGVIPYLDGSVHATVPQHLIPRHLYVSDCIILSAPAGEHNSIPPSYSGLEILVMRVIQVTQHLLDRGYLVRGGIAVGPVWHSDTNIVGPAYQEAFALEGVAKMPRVILSDAATKLWKSTARPAGNLMCDDYEDQLIVSGLHSYYIPKRFQDDISGAFKHYEAVITHNLNAGLDPNCHAKWLWMQRYLAHSAR